MTATTQTITNDTRQRQAAAIVRTLETFATPGQVVEVRVMVKKGRKRTDSGYFTDWNKLAAAVLPYDGKENIYFTLNPINPALLSRAANRIAEWVDQTSGDPDVTCRRWLPVDCNPVRPSGISATDEEKRQASERANKIVDYLVTEYGWPTPVVGDSGNGAHRCWQIDLPNDDESKTLISQCLKALNSLFGDEHVTVDVTNFNAARIWKLYATKAVKGDDTPDRPHRWAILEPGSQPGGMVTKAQIQNLAALMVELEPQREPQRPHTGKAWTPDDVESWMKKHGITGKGMNDRGVWKWKLDHCPMSNEHSDGAAIFLQPDGRLGFRCHHNSCNGFDWSHLREKYDGPREQRRHVHVNGASKKSATAPTDQSAPPDDDYIPPDPDGAPDVPPAEDASAPSFWLLHPAGEYGNTLCFHQVYGDRTAYNSAYGWMWRCDKAGHWLHGDIANARIDQAIIQLLLDRQLHAAQVKNDLIAAKAACTTRNISNVRAMGKSFVTKPVDLFDSEPHLLNTRSGVIDLRSGQVVVNESGQFTYCVPAEYNPATDYTPWFNWLDETIAHHTHEDMRDYMQMSVGYSITGYTREECLFYPWGPTRSGKGTFTNTLLTMLGAPLGAAAAFSTFTRKRDASSFDLAPLKAARLVISSEGKKGTFLNEATVKTITGRDPVVTSFKGKDEFSYIPVYKIWLVSNHPIGGDPDDDAFWNRIRVISFPTSRAGHEDKELKDRMATPAYLRMVLAYAVDGARMWWNETRGLVTPKVVSDATQAHRDALDSVGQWLSQNTVIKPEYEVSNSRLYPNYETWCEENGFSPKRGKTFAESMQNKGYERVMFRDHLQRVHRGYR